MNDLVWHVKRRLSACPTQSIVNFKEQQVELKRLLHKDITHKEEALMAMECTTELLQAGEGQELNSGCFYRTKLAHA